jgi:uncharacterized cupredoxin-like copper-binding protein
LHRASSLLKIGAVFLAAGLTLGVVACSDDDDDGPTGISTPAATATAAAGATNTPTGSTGADDEDTVEITAVDYEYRDLPDTVDVGTTFTMVNDSDEEAHEVVAIRLPDTETRSVEELLELPEEELGELAMIEPSFVLVAGPGDTAEAVLGTGTLTQPGRYLFACFIPVGADPDEFLGAATGAEGPPDVAGGPPHFTEGMFAEVTVE